MARKKSTKKAQVPKDLPFEEGVEQLEELLQRIESGEAGLEECIADYEQGVALIQHCKGILEHVEQRIANLTEDVNGNLVEEEGDEIVEGDYDDGEEDEGDEPPF